jgi:hypothetical protein
MATETRYQRIAREQRERQAAREQRLAAERKAARKPKRKPHIESYEDRLDDLGESPDY